MLVQAIDTCRDNAVDQAASLSALLIVLVGVYAIQKLTSFYTLIKAILLEVLSLLAGSR